MANSTHNRQSTTLERIYERDGLSSRHDSEKTVVVDGIQYTQRTFADRSSNNELSGPARFGRGVLAVAALPLTLVGALTKRFSNPTTSNAVTDFHRWAGESAVNGRVTRDVLHSATDPLDAERQEFPLNPNSRARNRLIERLGYDPKDRASIRAYLERPDIRSQLIESNGNYMLPQTPCEGRSSFLFVPKGDFSKASSIKMSDAKTGEALKGKEFHRAMHTYSTQYEDMIKGIEENLNNLAIQLGESRGLSKEQIEEQKENLKTEMRKQLRVAVLDHKRKNTRLYGNIDPNNRKLYINPLRGSRIDWSKPTSKDVDDIHKGAPDNKLSTNRPFANALPPQRQNEDD